MREPGLLGRQGCEGRTLEPVSLLVLAFLGILQTSPFTFTFPVRRACILGAAPTCELRPYTKPPALIYIARGRDRSDPTCELGVDVYIARGRG